LTPPVGRTQLVKGSRRGLESQCPRNGGAPGTPSRVGRPHSSTLARQPLGLRQCGKVHFIDALTTQHTLSRVEGRTWRHARRARNLHVDVVGVGRVAATTQTGPGSRGARRVESCLKMGSAGLVGLVNSRPRNAQKKGGARPGREGARTQADGGVAPRQTATGAATVAVPPRTSSCLQTGRLLPGEEGARPGDRNGQVEIMHKSNYRGPATKKYCLNAKFGQ